jgi:hypothetical protein
MDVSVQMYRAQARSEKERSGFELGMARKPKGRKPAARRSEADSSWAWLESRKGEGPQQTQMKEENDG